MRTIGEGGMGRVYLAFDPMLDMELAVKVVPRGIHSTPEERKRFKREIQLLAAINIPGVVRLFDCGEYDGWQYYTMEHVNGAAIDDYADEYDLSQQQRLKLIQDLADTLAELHESDIIHRDLKPSNILIMEDGSARLTDFSIAKSFDHTHSAITLNDTRPGTPVYMSPETSSSLRDPKVAEKADVYSLGVVAYELLTGRLPYDVENLTPTECVLVIREERPYSFSERDTSIPTEVEMVIMAMLEKDLDKRPDAKTLAGMLRQAIEGNPDLGEDEKPSTGWAMAAAAVLIGAFIVVLHAHLIQKREDRYAHTPDTADASSRPSTDSKTVDAIVQIPSDNGSSGTTTDTTIDNATPPDDPKDPEETPEQIYERTLARANTALAEKQWDAAEAAFIEIKKLPGYERSDKWQEGLQTVACGRLLEDATEAAKRGDWAVAKKKTEAVLELAPTHVLASALRYQAVKALVPKARISAWFNGKEVKGAQVMIGEIPLPQKTPLTLDLDVVDGKPLTIIADRTPEHLFKPYRITWKSFENNTLRAELKALSAVTAGDINMDMIPVESGTFFMGSNGDDSPSRPMHKVTLTQDFWISKHEVSQDQYFVITRKNPTRTRGQNFPVTNITWYAAVSFCAELTAREKKARRLPKGYVYRLPTEAEWEYACRAGTITPYPYNNDKVEWPKLIASRESKLESFAAVGYGKSNPWGIYNMNGNVREWVLDSYHAYTSKDQVDPAFDLRGSSKVVRGGSWRKPLDACTSFQRARSITGRRAFSDVGFRIVLAKPVK